MGYIYAMVTIHTGDSMATKKKKTVEPEAAPARSQSKKDFVLSLPNDMPAPEVVVKADAAGFKISQGYVYAIRSKAAAVAGAGARRGRRGKESGDVEAVLEVVAKKMGIANAISHLLGLIEG